MADKQIPQSHNAGLPVVRGELTYANLSGSDDFFLPTQRDAWGVSRPPFSPNIARMSAELAVDGYDLDVKPWIAAGWDDCIFIVEDHIVVLDRDGDSRLAALESEWKLRRAKSMLQGVSPVGDLMRAVRQLFVTDLGKTIVMTNIMPNGKAIVAISFIGTTQKFYDWFSNFKFQQKTGMHAGFLELACHFDEQATRILLPKASSELGEETFSLADAIIEAKKPDSKVLLWISGHSQGGALVQTYTHLLLSQGVLPEHIRAYTFAAPTVASANSSIDPKQYPIYHIVNMDDMVPRIGAQVRLGVDYLYHPNRAFRIRHYRVDEENEAAMERALHLNSQIQTMEEALIWAIALMRMMRDMQSDGELDEFFAELIPQLSALRMVNLSKPDIADFFERTLTNQLRTLSGQEPDAELCARYEDGMHVMLKEYGAKKASHALVKSLGGPHRLRADKKDEHFVSPYIAIARRHLIECEKGVWLPTAPAQCVDERGDVLLPLRDKGKRLRLEGAPPLLDGGENSPKPDDAGTNEAHASSSK